MTVVVDIDSSIVLPSLSVPVAGELGVECEVGVALVGVSEVVVAGGPELEPS